jgi:starch synthase
MAKKKILFVTHEMSPYTEGNLLAEAARALPQYMQDNDYEVRVFMPKFGNIKDRKHRLHEVIRLSGINIPVGNDDNPLIIKVASLPSAKMQIYFLDNEDFYKGRNYMHDDNGKFYDDNADRTVFFNKGVIEIILKLGWIPDVIHCQGWMAGLVPFYARTVARNEPVFKNTRFIYTVLGSEFDETLGSDFVEKATMGGQDKEVYKNLQDPSCNDLYLAGVTFADGITIGSEDVDASIRNYINVQDKPVLPYQNIGSDNFAETHDEFYSLLLNEAVL